MFDFIKTFAGRIGVGTSDMAFQRPRPVSIDSIYGPAYNVRGQIVTTAGGYMMVNKSVVPVSLTGNGAAIHGTPILSPLAEEG